MNIRITANRYENAAHASARAGRFLFVAIVLLAGARGWAAEEEGPTRFTIRLVDNQGRLVSDLESLQPIVKTIFDEAGTRTATLGERATLWVRNANIDGKFTFEQFHEGKYIRRSGELSLEQAKLGIGEHVINPGDHRFTVTPDLTLASDDPEISIDGDTLSLRLHRVEVLAVDGAMAGPPEFRLVAADFGVLELEPETTIDPNELPDPKGLRSMLSHVRKFYPLHVYLPSNTVGQGYVLYPSWQAFHVTPDGKVDVEGNKSLKVPGIEVDGLRVTIPYRKFFGKPNSKVGLRGGVGAVPLGGEMDFSPTLEPIRFTAGLGKPDEAFFLPVDPDFSKNPNKFFLADNTTRDPHAVRLLALEWGYPVYARGEAVTVALRFLETPGEQTLENPAAIMSYSRHYPNSPDERRWHKLPSPAKWQDDRLDFTVPEDLDYDFYFFRVAILEAGSRDTASPLSGEFVICVIEEGQTGTASFISNKGRDAFVAGETIRLQATLRSQAKRAAGERRVVLKHPDGRDERFAFQDSGEPWFVQPLELPAEITRNLKPGRYELAIGGVPPDIASVPFRFDLAGDQKISLYKIIKPSKYTESMNRLIPSHSHPNEPAIDLGRAVDSLAGLGYNRIDLMTYETNLHIRPYTEREKLAANDQRLMAPRSVYQPTPRNQLLNACVRNRIEFSDVFLSYNDFHLPRYIEGYIKASERWITREMLSMRHSPALAGMMLYDEMYDMGVTGLDKLHIKLLPSMRTALAGKVFGKPVAKIKSNMSRYVSRPKNQRDPEALKEYLAWGKWERHGWGDYNTRVANAARAVVPDAAMGTYHRTWMTVGASIGILNGYPPDVFEGLDICAHVHYADNATGWQQSPMLVPALRFGRKRQVFVNVPLSHESRGWCNGEYQRHMAFAMLAQGADGVSQWGLPASFANGPNTGMVFGKETTQHLNRQILAPFGELMSKTDYGYKQVGIVNTLNQHLLSDFNPINVAHQVEVLWIACWRLGYPAILLHEDAFEQSVGEFKVIFVPGIRFDNELEPMVMQRLEEAAKAGTKIVVEKGGELDIPGVVKLDNPLLDYYVRAYFPTWRDDELHKVFDESQPATDYFAKKMPELGAEPSARGPFKVGPNWRRSGDINYLVMANYDDPEYGHTVKQIMARPVRMPLTVAAHRGKVAYDLLAQSPLPLADRDGEIALELDMTRCQGGLVAFLPDDIAELRLSVETTNDNRQMRLDAGLTGKAGKAIDGVFPTRIRLMDAQGRLEQEFFRVLGNDLRFEMNLPAGTAPRKLTLEVRENISGRTVKTRLDAPVRTDRAVRFVDVAEPFVPYPHEVKKFMADTKRATLVVPAAIPGLGAVADELAAALKARGMDVTIKDESAAYAFPAGDTDQADPMNDGFHSWRAGHEAIQPATVVDGPVILMAAESGSYLLDGLVTNGYLTQAPDGGPGLAVRPTIQVAAKALHYDHDTLCLIANDVTGMKSAVETLLEALPRAPKEAQPAYAAKEQVTSGETARIAPAFDFLGNNELIIGMSFDKAGNLYVNTWGHGDNLYSLEPSGKLRFSRHLPEMGAWRADVYDDRILVATAAGSRLYQMTLDGEPISQVRLTMDPGPPADDEYGLSYPQYQYLPATNQVIQNIGSMRIVDENGNVVQQWQGETYTDKDVADKILRRKPRAYALSPDGSRIAQLETSHYFTRVSHEDITAYDSHAVIRDLTGKLLHEYKNVANQANRVTGTIRWAPGDPGPAVIVKGEKWQFDDKLNVLYTKAYELGEFQLGGERRLVRDGNALRYLTGDKPEVSRIGPLDIMPTYAQLSPDGKLIALLDEHGRLAIHEAPTGKLRTEITVPQLGRVLRFSADSSALLVGGQRGLVMNYDLEGKLLWQVSLGKFNKTLENTPLYDPSFKDLTSTLWPEEHDRPGELDKIVRMGESRLVNGDCESQAGWQGGQVAYHNEGHGGASSLRVGGMIVHQKVTKYLGNHVTWVLEFFYKAAPGSQAPELLAGVLADSKYPYSTARTFTAGEAWRFARVAVKSGAQCRALTIGFRAGGGEALVDSATLRQIRFPSVNHLHYEPLYDIDPVILSNALFTEDYDPVGNVRFQAFGQVSVPPYGAGGKPVVEPAFMQNGRINDVSSFWYEMPQFMLSMSMALKEPRWISHLAVFFNYYDEKNVTPHFDVYVTDAESRKEILVASVRNNRKLFQLLKFPPIKTATVKFEFINTIKRLRTVTEIELYGPLSGKEGQAGFADSEGQNTYMGDFTRVDKRKKTLAPAYGAPVQQSFGHGDQELLWAVCTSQIVAGDDKFYVSRSLGFSEMYTLDQPVKSKSFVRGKALTFGPHVTLYGGLLLKCGSHGRLYCIDADTSQEIWSVRLGERTCAAPVAVAEDVFIASDSSFTGGPGGKLYKLDLANGSVMMETDLSGGVLGALATDGSRLFMITDDGLVQCFDMRNFKKLWSVEVAPYTDSAPAVDAGVVYTADQKGTVRALDAATGNVRWKAELGQEFTRCPVVTEQHVILGCRGGKLAVLNRADGAQVWSKQVAGRFSYEPVALGDSLLYFEGNAAMLASLADGAARPVQAPVPRSREEKLEPVTINSDPLTSISYYKGRLFFVSRCEHEGMQLNYPWHMLGGRFYVLSPKEEEKK